MGLPTPLLFARPFRLAAIATAAALVLSAMSGPVQAQADTRPADETLPATVSSDSLPTVQIDGIVWSQVIVGNTVYAGGSFATAQPAGSAAGVNTVPRANLLAYNLETGALITSFAPSLNGQVRGLTASPDGRRLYAVGEFTTVNGVQRNRIAAFDTATGALVTGFAPSANSRISSVAATNDTVYFGGTMTAVSGVARPGRAAAVRASNGAVLPWAPVADTNGRVTAMVLSPDNSKLVLGGNFTSLNGSSNPGYGLAAVDATTGTTNLPWNVNGLVRNAGVDAAITSLSSDGTSVYGTGYVFGSGGNLEGAFRASWESGDLVWLQDCHGDTYSSYATPDVSYIAGHPHYCGNVDGGFEQTEPWTFYRALAFTNRATSTLGRDPHGYYNFEGRPSPTLLHFYPTFNTGTVSGATQGPWSVTGSGDYIVYGGEFTTVNGRRQQGLARFATAAKAPNTDGPRVSGANWEPSLASFATGTVRVAWPANYDRDNASLTYRVIRDGNNASPIYETTAQSSPWNRPSMGFLDTGLTPGSSHTYRIRAEDPHGNVAWSGIVPVTVSADGTVSDYAAEVLADQPQSYWRLGEAAGTTAYDWASYDDAVVGPGVTRGAAGAIGGDDNAASAFPGNDTGLVATQNLEPGRNAFAVEAWFNTRSNRGGKIVGFGNANTRNSSSYDRHVYLDRAGRVFFGVYPGAERTVSSAPGFNDGSWHHVVANLGPAGMQLYVDGRRVAQRVDTTSGQSYDGYWRIGGDSSWGGTAQYFTGSIDDVAVYQQPLTGAEVNRHYTLSGRSSALPTAPTDAYGAQVYNDGPDSYWRLDETEGTAARDSSAGDAAGVYQGGVTKQQTGAIAGTTNRAALFDGSTGVVVSSRQVNDPQVYSTELWFNSRTTAGGKLIGFGNAESGTSGSYDRHVYLQPDGRLVFGTWIGSANTVTTPSAYNDGAWHHMVATQSSAGLRLYVDGELRASNSTGWAQGYVGYWRIGGDNTWGSAPFVNALIDEAAVYSVALSSEQVAQHYRLGVGSKPNVAPVASFSAEVSGLSVAVDGSASSDSDGSVESYSWDFGDGGSASGATASHRYAAAGTYTVRLTVRDDGGAESVTSREVSVVAPPANVAPVASFSAEVSELSVAVDGSASSDSDGSVASYSWDFGDGGSASGATASHRYAAAGTYTVRLTVTDDAGATGTSTSTVTVAAPVVELLASDAFERSTVDALGSADVGGAWVLGSPAASFSVSGGVGRFSTPAGSARSAYLQSVSSVDTEVQVTAAIQQPVTGSGAYVSVLARRSAAGEYLGRVKVLTDGAVSLQVMRDGTSLQNVSLPGLRVGAGDRMQIRVQAVGTSPTTVRAKVWPVGTAEPGAWQVNAVDSTTGLQQAGHVGLRSYLSGSAGSPIVFTFDGLKAGAPGSFGTAEPTPNAVPVASFSASTSDLSVSVDGSGSSDSDGSVRSYAWDFGDGGSASGVTASHRYAAAGTYAVTLTIRDDAGATDTSTSTVTVSEAPALELLASDAFERSVLNGLGTADRGGPWSVGSPASSFSVSDGAARFSTPPGGSRNAYLRSVFSLNTEVRVAATVEQPVTGSGAYVSVLARRTDAGEYSGRVKILSDGTASIQVMRDGTSLRTVALPDTRFQAGDRMEIRVQAVGALPATVRAKAWLAGTAEPDVWQVSATDSTAGLQGAGHVGLRSYLSGTAVDTTVFTFDRLEVEEL